MRIRPVIRSDIPILAAMAHRRRLDYAKQPPDFWRPAEGAEEGTRAYFDSMLDSEDWILLVLDDGAAANEQDITGFIIGQIIDAPPCYDPGGKTLFIDDFCTAEPALWSTAGSALLDAMMAEGRMRGHAQILVICGHHDTAKGATIKSRPLVPTSTYWTRRLDK